MVMKLIGIDGKDEEGLLISLPGRFVSDTFFFAFCNVFFFFCDFMLCFEMVIIGSC
jgi:hypothetical protein